jgi:hypothetical protein
MNLINKIKQSICKWGYDVSVRHVSNLKLRIKQLKEELNDIDVIYVDSQRKIDRLSAKIEKLSSRLYRAIDLRDRYKKCLSP